MRKIGFLLLITFMCCITDNMRAQTEKVWFAISDGMDNQNLMSTIENNTMSFLNACNEAILKKKKPDFPSGVVAKSSSKTIMSFWETTPMYCSKTYISEKCLKKPAGGFQVRNIAINIPDAPEDQQDQEIVINFTNSGEIESISISLEETRYREIMEEYITDRKSVV